MSRAFDFFTPTQRDQIKEAIAKSEKLTSGEIRVHIENRTEIDVLDRAAYVFENLGMHRTKERNAVLIYMAVQDGRFAILGDAGIHQILGSDYWSQTRDSLLKYFNDQAFVEGLEWAIADIGNRLSENFPISEEDVNELENEITDDISLNEN
ncbi:MAG: TPM domain-containing protein [Bacteroidota bacterium]